MDKFVRLFLRLGALLDPAGARQEALRPIPVPVRPHPTHIPGARR